MPLTAGPPEPLVVSDETQPIPSTRLTHSKVSYSGGSGISPLEIYCGYNSFITLNDPLLLCFPSLAKNPVRIPVCTHTFIFTESSSVVLRAALIWEKGIYIYIYIYIYSIYIYIVYIYISVCVWGQHPRPPAVVFPLPRKNPGIPVCKHNLSSQKLISGAKSCFVSEREVSNLVQSI